MPVSGVRLSSLAVGSTLVPSARGFEFGLGPGLSALFNSYRKTAVTSHSQISRPKSIIVDFIVTFKHIGP